MMQHFTIILTLIIPLGLFSQNDLKLKGHLINGVDSFKSEEYNEASMSFASGGSLEGYEDIATYNRGLSLLASKNLSDANSAFSNAIENTKNPMIKSRSWYNMGNVALMDSIPEPETAIEAYKSALRIDPSYEEARHNLAVAYKMLQQQQDQQQQDQNHLRTWLALASRHCKNLSSQSRHRRASRVRGNSRHQKQSHLVHTLAQVHE